MWFRIAIIYCTCKWLYIQKRQANKPVFTSQIQQVLGSYHKTPKQPPARTWNPESCLAPPFFLSGRRECWSWSVMWNAIICFSVLEVESEWLRQMLNKLVEATGVPRLLNRSPWLFYFSVNKNNFWRPSKKKFVSGSKLFEVCLSSFHCHFSMCSVYPLAGVVWPENCHLFWNETWTCRKNCLKVRSAWSTLPEKHEVHDVLCKK